LFTVPPHQRDYTSRKQSYFTFFGGDGRDAAHDGDIYGEIDGGLRALEAELDNASCGPRIYGTICEGWSPCTYAACLSCPSPGPPGRTLVLAQCDSALAFGAPRFFAMHPVYRE